MDWELTSDILQFVGREQVDHIVSGFTMLLKQCLQKAPSGNVAENTR
jgi:hypothetical protein